MVRAAWGGGDRNGKSPGRGEKGDGKSAHRRKLLNSDIAMNCLTVKGYKNARYLYLTGKRVKFDRNEKIAYNIFNKGAGRIGANYPLRR